MGNQKVPPFYQGERLDRTAFHARYLCTPEDYHAELIGGAVHLARRTTWSHGRTVSLLNRLLSEYEEQTPGVGCYLRVTVLLNDQSEPQPDLCVVVDPECGGQTWDEEDLLAGAPELIGEVADDTEELDLGTKRLDYERAGVKEYLVVALRQQRVYWFVLRDEAFVELPLGPDGIFRSEVFPGLWLDPAALLHGDMAKVRATLAAGLATPEHAAFVAR